ncbi:MAG: hypothetical protein O2981_03690 [Proteobacteria bacterium]|nr:hypothetical protein [Pseudomonadota bacterium]
MERQIVLWQALTPWAVRILKQTAGWQIPVSAPGDTYALLKPSRLNAHSVAETVWAPRYGMAAVISVVLPRELVQQLPSGSVAYEEHRDYIVAKEQLDALSGALLKPARVVEVVTGRTHQPLAMGLVG